MPQNPDELIDQRWVHSYEEDTPTEQVFRPSTYKLPPSRGRLSFELKADGRLIRHGLGLSDRTQVSEGTWKLENNKLLLSSQSARSPKQVLKILSAAPDRLVVEK
jgi:hypothetical protein